MLASAEQNTTLPGLCLFLGPRSRVILSCPCCYKGRVMIMASSLFNSPSWPWSSTLSGFLQTYLWIQWEVHKSGNVRGHVRCDWETNQTPDIWLVLHFLSLWGFIYYRQLIKTSWFFMVHARLEELLPWFWQEKKGSWKEGREGRKEGREGEEERKERKKGELIKDESR